MDTSKHDFGGLFSQLGLPNDVPSMKAFIASHSLPPGIALADADFWQPFQASFLAEELAEDGDWAEVIDELALLLSK